MYVGEYVTQVLIFVVATIYFFLFFWSFALMIELPFALAVTFTAEWLVETEMLASFIRTYI